MCPQDRPSWKGSVSSHCKGTKRLLARVAGGEGGLVSEFSFLTVSECFLESGMGLVW